MRIDVTALEAIDRAKAARLQAMLDQSPISGWIAHDKPCLFRTTTETNPASIYNPESVDPKGSLLIEIAAWFYRNYTAGYICGMLCHEVGAHFMADANLTVQPRSPLKGLQERSITQARLDKAKDHLNSEEWITSGGFSIRCGATNLEFTPSEATQPDHIYASCYGFARNDYYRNLLLQFALIIASDTDLFTAKDMPDLIDCWLMDIASIAATGDKRARGVFSPGDVAQVYNQHLAMLKRDVNGLTGNAAVRTAVADTPNKTKGQVFSAYKDMLPKMFK